MSIRLLLSSATALVSFATFTACGDDSCSSNADCAEGQICQIGLCIRDPGLGDTTLPDGGEVNLDCDPAVGGELVLNEIMADPPANTDINNDGITTSANDEFIEIVNVSGREVNLSNVQLDIKGKLIPAGVFCLAPNEARVIYGGEVSLGLTNSGATVSLLVDGLITQSHTYGAEGGDNQSLVLTPELDPNGTWVQHTTVSAAAYSPFTCVGGEAFPNCTVSTGGDDSDPDTVEVVPDCSGVPTVGSVIINEVLADPGSSLDNDANQDGVTSSSEDEFIELVNVGTETYHMGGYMLLEGSGKSFAFPTGTCLAPGQALVMFGKYESGGDFAGAQPFGFGGSFQLNNDGDTVRLEAPDATVIDSVTYGSEASSDQSVNRAIDMDPSSALVQHSTVATSGGATSSAGRCANGNGFPECDGGVVVEPDPDVMDDTTGDVTPPVDTAGPPACGPMAVATQLIINEVMANPGGADWNQDGVSDSGDDEFVELVSLALEPIALDGVSIVDAAGNDFVFGSACLNPGEAVLVFGGGSPFAVSVVPAGNAPPQVGAPGINNGSETLQLKAADGTVIDNYSHASATAGVSNTRAPDGLGFGFVEHGTALNAIGSASPGTCLNGDAFPGCLTP